MRREFVSSVCDIEKNHLCSADRYDVTHVKMPTENL